MKFSNSIAVTIPKSAGVLKAAPVSLIQPLRIYEGHANVLGIFGVLLNDDPCGSLC